MTQPDEPPDEPRDEPGKDDLADALHALSDGAQTDADLGEEVEESQEQMVAGFDMTGRSIRPDAPQRTPVAARPDPADAESDELTPSSFDDITEDETVAVPAPSEEALASAAMLRPAARVRTEPRAVFIQRTIIPILLTLSLLLPAIAIWVLTRPDESQVRAVMSGWPMYLFIAGALTLVLAIVNMLQVRARTRVVARVATDENRVLQSD